jgi:PAS domain S-box-containing protein
VPLSKEKLEELIGRSTDIIVATNRKGNIVYYNDGATRSLGYQQSEILDRYVGTVYPDLDEARRVMKAMRGPGHGGAGIVETLPTTFLSKAGERIPVAMSATLTYDESGEADGTIGFAKDVREILRKDKLATLGEVAVGLSHEINNPLSVIVNQVELLSREIEELAGDRDSSVEIERILAVRREITRISDILTRFGEMVETESYETMQYIGPARMIDLRSPAVRATGDQRLKGLLVLVVDDDMGICRSIAEILSADGCGVETACDGREALQRLANAHFDVVLTDVVMPNMDGYELYTTLRETHPDLPVLMMTAFHYDKDHIIKRSKLKGLKGVLFKKPVDPERLREVVLQVVRSEREASVD